jgi:hypothetical protein
MGAATAALARAPRERAAEDIVLLSSLAQAVGSALLAGVQHATELNWQSARTLLHAAGAPTQAAEDTVDAWKMSWHAYQVCNTTTREVLALCQGYCKGNLDELWVALETLASHPLLARRGQVEQVERAFMALRCAQREMIESAARLQAVLLALARGAGDA